MLFEQLKQLRARCLDKMRTPFTDGVRLRCKRRLALSLGVMSGRVRSLNRKEFELLGLEWAEGFHREPEVVSDAVRAACERTVLAALTEGGD